MRKVLVAATVVLLSMPAWAQDVCSNIRLSVSDQLACRGRMTNALGDADRTRIQQEYEGQVRRENDRMITPPAVVSPTPPALTGGVPPTARQPELLPSPVLPRTTDPPGDGDKATLTPVPPPEAATPAPTPGLGLPPIPGPTTPQ